MSADTLTKDQSLELMQAEIKRLRGENDALKDEVELKAAALTGTSRVMGEEIERLRGELDSLGKAFVVAINAASDESLRHYCEKEGWDFEATRALGSPVAVITDPELVRVLNLDTKDTNIQRFEKALMACQEDREKAHSRADRLRELLVSVSARLVLMRGPSLLKGPEDRLIAEVLQEIEGALGSEPNTTAEEAVREWNTRA